MKRVLALLFDGIQQSALDVLVGLLPIVVIFLVLQFVGLHIKKKPFLRILSGFGVVYVGLVLFMQGVHIAFLPVGTHIGAALAALRYQWLLVPIGFVMGFVVAFAEPAVHVMIKQVEDLSHGTIKAKVMLVVISLGVAAAVSLAMVKLITGLSLWWFLIPGYILVFILARNTDPTFVAMAFDNGGVSTGPMCSTFILSMSVSIATNMPGRNPMLDGFGIVSLVALAPIISTLLLSYVYHSKDQKKAQSADSSGT